MAKSTQYETTKGPKEDSFSELNNKLTKDFKGSIRAISKVKVLSDAWFELGSHFTRLAHVSNVERAIAEAKDDSRTLWETEEEATRMLIEEGRLNSFMRDLIEFKGRQQRSQYFKEYSTGRKKCCQE